MTLEEIVEFLRFIFGDPWRFEYFSEGPCTTIRRLNETGGILSQVQFWSTGDGHRIAVCKEGYPVHELTEEQAKVILDMIERAGDDRREEICSGIEPEA